MKKLLFIFAMLLVSVALQAQSEIKINQPYRFLKSPYVLLNTDTAATKAYVRATHNFTAGTGITLSGTTFSHTAHTGDATGSTALTVVALQGRSIATTVPTSTNILSWNGSSWGPASNLPYTAGTGITISGTTINSTDITAYSGTPYPDWTVKYKGSTSTWEAKPIWTGIEEFANIAANLPSPNNLLFVAYASTGTVTAAAPVDGDILSRALFSTGATANQYVGIGTSNFILTPQTAGTGLYTGSKNHSYTILFTNVQIPVLSDGTQGFVFTVGMLGGVSQATTLPSYGCFLQYNQALSTNWLMYERGAGVTLNATTQTSIPVVANQYYNLAVHFNSFNNTTTTNWYIGVGTTNPNNGSYPLTIANLVGSNVTTTMTSASSWGVGLILGKSLGTVARTISIDGIKQAME